MSFTAPSSFVALSTPTAADLNALVDAINYLAGGSSGTRPCFRAHNASAHNVSNNTTTSPTVFDTTDEDTDSGYNNTTGLYTVATAGLWIFTASIFYASNSTGVRRGYITATSAAPGQARGADVSAAVDSIGLCNPTLITRVSVGSTVAVATFQNSGGTLALGSGANCAFSGAWLGL